MDGADAKQRSSMAGPHAADARDARKHLRRKALEFDEADADGDQEIGYDEFCEYILPKVRGARHTDADLKEWWALMDIDGDGFIRKDEYFLYTLCAASRKAGSGINAIFAEFDKDGSGNLDEIEFEQALETMGFGDAATAVFEEYQNATTRTVSYLTLLKKVEERTILPAMRSFLMALASDSMIKVDTSRWSFGGATPQEARSGLATLLKKHSVRLSNLFQQLDDDGSFSLTLAELKDAFWELGYTGKPEVVGEIFSSLDQDGSGKAGFDEFNAWVHGRKLERNRPEDRAARLSLVPQLQISFDAGDDAWTPGRLQVELNAALGAEGLRGVDLLKAWDCGKLDDKLDDGPSVRSMTAHLPDRQLSQKEYLIAFKRLCGGGELWYAMARDAAHEAFKMIDKSGDKAIGVAELCRWVDPHGRLVAAGRSKSRKAAALPTGSVVAEKPEAKVEDGEEEQHAQSSVCCYSPTKLSTRIAQIRAYDPDLLKPPPKAASRARKPLWEPRELPPPPQALKPSVCGRDISHLKWRQPGSHGPLAGLRTTSLAKAEVSAAATEADIEDQPTGNGSGPGAAAGARAVQSAVDASPLSLEDVYKGLNPAANPLTKAAGDAITSAAASRVTSLQASKASSPGASTTASAIASAVVSKVVSTVVSTVATPAASPRASLTILTNVEPSVAVQSPRASAAGTLKLSALVDDARGSAQVSDWYTSRDLLAQAYSEQAAASKRVQRTQGLRGCSLTATPHSDAGAAAATAPVSTTTAAAAPTTAGSLLSTARLPEGFASVTATEGVADGAAVCLDTPSRGLRFAIAQAAHSGWSADRLQASFTEISRLEGFDLPPSALSCPILGVGRAGAPTPRSARLMRPATAPFRTSMARVPVGSAHVVTPRGSKGAQAASPRASLTRAPLTKPVPALRDGVVVFTPRQAVIN